MTDVLDGDKINFAFNDDGRVMTYSRKVSDETDIATVYVSYPNISKTIYRFDNYTDDEVQDDIYTYYLFDNAGHTVNAYATDAYGNILGASNAVYTETQATSKKNNRTERLASMGVAGQQLMHNSSFESSNTEATIAWTLGSGCSISENKHRTGFKSLKGSLTNASGTAYATKASQSLSKNTTYTLSAYVNTTTFVAFSGRGVYLRVTDPSGRTWDSPSVNYRTSSAIEGGWARISVTFTATSDGTHTIGVYGTGLIGTFYVDDLQLEKGEAPSNRNLLSNGSMEHGDYGWDFGNGSRVEFGTDPEVTDSRFIKITGKPNLDNTNAYQEVAVNLSPYETYVLSGWVKANSVPDNVDTTNEEDGEVSAQDVNKQCGLRAVIIYANGSEEYHYVPFNPDIAEWQFTSMAIVPEKTDAGNVSSIQVYCAYEKNANVAYFDNISLVREIAQTMAYDEDGNLISVTSTGLNTETSEYEEGNLMEAVTGSNGTYQYFYDDEYKHRLTSVTNSLVTQSYGYDSVGNVTSTTLAPNGGGKQLQTSATYTNNKNLTASITDAAGNTTTYAYGNNLSKMLGVPTSTTNAKGVTGTAVYDGFGRITQTAVANKAKLVYSYSGNKLMGMTRTDLATSKAQSYTFNYDALGRTTGVSVGNRTLATYAYDGNKDLLLTQTYGNGHAVSFTYDNLGRTKTATYSDGRVLTYTYTGDGLLHSVDVKGGPAPATYLYSYDTLGRLIYSEMQDGSGNMILRTHQSYNEKNQLCGQSWQLGETGYGETYEYNEADGSLNTMTSATGQTLQMNYDALRRLSSVNAGIYTRTYTYRDVSDTQTTTQIASVTYSGLTDSPSDDLTYSYTYDAVGNIATYTAPDGEVITYTYDDQGQLLSAVGDQTYTYTYDNVGNKLKGDIYIYGDSTWGDLLTAIDGKTISYDEIGNPLNWYNGSSWTLTWENGRQLKEIKHISGGRKTTFTYDADGLRLSKTCEGTTHDYTYAGGKLMREVITRSASGTVEVWDFFYDEAGRPFAVKVDGVMYYYITNLQGDVMQIVDANGATIATYEYDPYGDNAGITGAFGYSNPIRYRGYYYDRESDLYYLQSRYYDPSVGRFINADSYASTGQGCIGNNMFAYCLNNPIVFMDYSGTAAHICFVHDGYIDNTPWRDDSPRGGLPRGICITGTGYSSVEDTPFWLAVLEFIFNDDEQAVIDAKYFAFYKGQLVIKQDWAITDGRSFSFGIMFLHKSETDIQTVRHEWGHFVQLVQMGPVGYVVNVAIPSVTSDGRDPYYYSNPWERMADYFGGVNRSEGYRKNSFAWGVAQYFMGPIVVPLYYIFEE